MDGGRSATQGVTGGDQISRRCPHDRTRSTEGFLQLADDGHEPLLDTPHARGGLSMMSLIEWGYRSLSGRSAH